MYKRTRQTTKRTHARTRTHAHTHTHTRAHTLRYTHATYAHTTGTPSVGCAHDRKRATTHITTHRLILLTLLRIHTPHTPQVRDQWVVHMTKRGGAGGLMSPRGGAGEKGGGSMPPPSPRQSLAHSLLSPTTSPRPRTPLKVVLLLTTTTTNYYY
jgi:hypothetical protein